MKTESGVRVQNWEGSVISYPAIVAHPNDVDDIVAIMKNADQYPAPVRAVGSNHSTSKCATADGGTLVDMRNMNRIISVGTDTVTAQAGALYIDVAQELQNHHLQFTVNVEIGSLSIGSAACGGTKDASMPGEFGQVCSYAISMKLVTAAGELLEVTEDQPELLQMMRSSYGLLGIVYEATFRVTPLKPMRVHHVTYSLDEFSEQLPELWARGESMFLYMTPFLGKITVEYRSYVDGPPPAPGGWKWRLRNFVWKTTGPYIAYLLTKYLPFKAVRYFIIDRMNQVVNYILTFVLRGEHTVPTNQIIRYPEKATNSKYSFSIWAFPEERYAGLIREYFAFCHQYYREHGYRCNLLNVAYRIAKDTSSLFSYSSDGNVMTLDPVSTADPGWEDFLVAYNEFSSQHGGVPLFNQTKSITPAQARLAFGDRLDRFNKVRKEYDPDDRLLSAYFAGMLE